MRELEGLEKFNFIVSLLEESEVIEEYIRQVMQKSKKKLLNQAIKEFPIVLADMIFDNWTITEEKLRCE